MRYPIKCMVLLLVVFASCEDFVDDNYDFSNSLAQYVEFSSGSEVEAEAGAEVGLTVRMRETINVPVMINYDIVGDLSSSGTVTIGAGDLSTSIAVQVPSDPANGSLEVSLSGVDNNLTLGRGGPDAGLSAIKRTISW